MTMVRHHENDALMIGRFQPFHKGHLEVIRKVVAESDSLTVGIGSAQISHEVENPFTAGERYLMISQALRDDGMDDFHLVPIVDINRYSVWVAHVESMVPPFSKVYTNNPLTKRLFMEEGYRIEAAPLFNREEYSGTEVRRRMIGGEEWGHLVPDAVRRVVEDVDGERRLRDLVGGT